MSSEQEKWIHVDDELPRSGEIVLACWPGVYGPRIVHFWKDDGDNHHFGWHTEPDGKGSQPATYWMRIPPLPKL